MEERIKENSMEIKYLKKAFEGMLGEITKMNENMVGQIQMLTKLFAQKEKDFDDRYMRKDITETLLKSVIEKLDSHIIESKVSHHDTHARQDKIDSRVSELESHVPLLKEIRDDRKDIKSRTIDILFKFGHWIVIAAVGIFLGAKR